MGLGGFLFLFVLFTWFFILWNEIKINKNYLQGFTSQGTANRRKTWHYSFTIVTIFSQFTSWRSSFSVEVTFSLDTYKPPLCQVQGFFLREQNRSCALKYLECFLFKFAEQRCNFRELCHRSLECKIRYERSFPGTDSSGHTCLMTSVFLRGEFMMWLSLLQINRALPFSTWRDQTVPRDLQISPLNENPHTNN